MRNKNEKWKLWRRNENEKQKNGHFKGIKIEE